jgi:hypothetical protein
MDSAATAAEALAAKNRIRRPSPPPGKTGTCRKIRSITSASTCGRGSRVTVSGSGDRWRGSAAFNPFVQHDGRFGV